MNNSKGQNVMEYILLVTAVVIVCIFFFLGGPMKTTLNATLNSIINDVNSVNGAIKFQ